MGRAGRVGGGTRSYPRKQTPADAISEERPLVGKHALFEVTWPLLK